MGLNKKWFEGASKEVICPTCGIEFVSSWKNGYKRFCSVKCMTSNTEMIEKQNAARKLKYDTDFDYREHCKRSDACKVKISANNKGKTLGRPKTEDHRKKIGDGNRGKTKIGLVGKTYEEIHGEEEAKRLLELRRLQMINNPVSKRPDAREKIQNAQLENWNNEEFRKTQFELSKNLWQDSKYREKMSAMRRGEANPMFGKSGELCPSWKGGISFEPYSLDWIEAFKENIRQRDNNTCQLCGKEWEPGTRRFHVHHIDYNKKNCDQQNLTTLCLSCHPKTNYNRDAWLGIFNATQQPVTV